MRFIFMAILLLFTPLVFAANYSDWQGTEGFLRFCIGWSISWSAMFLAGVFFTFQIFQKSLLFIVISVGAAVASLRVSPPSDIVTIIAIIMACMAGATILDIQKGLFSPKQYWIFVGLYYVCIFAALPVILFSI